MVPPSWRSPSPSHSRRRSSRPKITPRTLDSPSQHSGPQGGSAWRRIRREIEARLVRPRLFKAAGREIGQCTTLSESSVTAGGFLCADVEVVCRLQRRQQSPALVGAVAAGISAATNLGERQRASLGPVQWWPSTREPKIGPSGPTSPRATSVGPGGLLHTQPLRPPLLATLLTVRTAWA